jgi:hypothetical protein
MMNHQKSDTHCILAITYTGKGNFARRSLLQQQSTITAVKDEDGKGTVQNGMWLLQRKDVRILFTGIAHNFIAVVEHQDRVAFHKVELRKLAMPVPRGSGGGSGSCSVLHVVVHLLFWCHLSFAFVICFLCFLSIV